MDGNDWLQNKQRLYDLFESGKKPHELIGQFRDGTIRMSYWIWQSNIKPLKTEINNIIERLSNIALEQQTLNERLNDLQRKLNSYYK